MPLSTASIAQALYNSLVVFLSFYPIWLPFLLGAVLIEDWLHYVRLKYVAKQGEVLLEVKLPREVTKSPLAMEILLAALWQKGSATLHDTYLGGKHRPWFSLEIASIGGQVHFYIWTVPKYRALIESQIYAQYPGVEISEAVDYTRKWKHDPENMPMWSTYFKLSKSPWVPIKSYVEYGLDKASEKEEFKHDPLSATLEYMGSLQAGEEVWLQILFQAHREVGFLDGHLRPKDNWRAEGKKEIEKIRKEATIEPEGEEGSSRVLLSEMQKDLISAVERNISKHAFDVAIRGMYIATKEANRIAERVPGLIGAFRQFSAPEYFNELRIGFFTDFDYPWQDFLRYRRNARERRMLDAYKKRSYFQPPHKYYGQSRIILNTESLATIYHFPGAVVTTPTLSRIESKRSDAPANLPV